MSQSKFIVFYGQQIYGEYTKDDLKLRYIQHYEFPDGCYMRNPFTRCWYIQIGGSMSPINYSDIPPEVRLNCLLMGIPA